MKTEIELLKKYNITEKTFNHNYEYLFKSVLSAMREFASQDKDPTQSWSIIFNKYCEHYKRDSFKMKDSVCFSLWLQDNYLPPPPKTK